MTAQVRLSRAAAPIVAVGPAPDSGRAGAVLMLADGTRRGRTGQLALLCALTTVVAAVVLSTAAGVHRTATVLDRYISSTNQGDVEVFVSGLEATATVERLRSVKGVTDVAAGTMFMVSPDDPAMAFNFGLLADPSGRLGSDVGELLLVDGRLANPDNPSEVVVNEPAAQYVSPGDVLSVSSISPETFAAVLAGTSGIRLDGPQLELEVVGVVRMADDLQGSVQQSSPMAFAGRGFASHHRDDIGAGQAIARVVTDRSAATEQRIRDAATGDVQFAVSTVDEAWAGTTRTVIATIGTILAVFGVVVAIVGAIAVGAAMSRQVAQASSSASIAFALGMERRERRVAIAVPVALAALIGVGVGAIGAFLLSWAFPVGLARDIEPHPGLRFDPLVLLGGSLALSIGVVVWGLCTAAWADRAVTQSTSSSRPRPIGRWARVRTPIAAVLGARMAVHPGTGRTAVPARSAVVAVTAAVAGVVAVAVFSASMGTATSDPTQYGWTWSRTTFSQSGNTDPLATMSAVAATGGVDAVGGSVRFDGELDGDPVEVQTIYSHSGSIQPPLTQGRLPAAASEVALGRTTMHERGVEIGDDVNLALADQGPRTFRVVGQVVGSSLLDQPDWGDFAYVGNDGAAALAGVSTPAEVLSATQFATSAEVVIRFDAGADERAVMDDLHRRLDLVFPSSSAPSPPGRLTSLARMAPLFVALAAFFAVLGTVALAHLLLVSSRRRVPDFAVLRSLGALRSTVRGIVTVQSVVVVAMGLVVGIPLGIAVGRWFWSTTIASVGMAVRPVIPFGRLAALAVGGVVMAVVLSLWPGRRAASADTVRELRAE